MSIPHVPLKVILSIKSGDADKELIPGNLVTQCTIIPFRWIKILTNSPLVLFSLFLQFRNMHDSTSGTKLWEIVSRALCICILSARRLPCLCKTVSSPGAVFTKNLVCCLMETRTNVIFQTKAILIEGDPNIT